MVGITISTLAFSQIEAGKMRIMVGYGLPNIPAKSLSNTSASSGPLEIGYKYSINDKWSIGLMYNHSSATTEDININDGNGNDYTYSFGVTFNTFLTQVDYHWANTEKYNLYSGIGLGYVSVTGTTNMTVNTGVNPDPTDPTLTFSAVSSGMAYHITAIGINSKIVGGLGVYSELGVGYNGYFNAGLSYTF